MKNKTTPWTAQEEAELVQAVKDKTSATRLSVRLNRSVASIKRRMRDLGLAGQRRAPKDPNHFDPVIQVGNWLETCRYGDLVGLLGFYAPDATLECACSGAAVYAGASAILQYWQPKLLHPHPQSFALSAVRVEGERVAVDYSSYDGKPVRMYLTFEESGKITRSECGPRNRTELAA